jgi:hypothetical protein
MCYWNTICEKGKTVVHITLNLDRSPKISKQNISPIRKPVSEQKMGACNNYPMEAIYKFSAISWDHQLIQQQAEQLIQQQAEQLIQQQAEQLIQLTASSQPPRNETIFGEESVRQVEQVSNDFVKLKGQCHELLTTIFSTFWSTNYQTLVSVANFSLRHCCGTTHLCHCDSAKLCLCGAFDYFTMVSSASV